MGGQSWKVSLLESLSNTAIGFVISLLVWYGIKYSGVYEIHTTAAEGLEITLLFTIMSVARGYGLRRFYNWQHRRLEELINE